MKSSFFYFIIIYIIFLSSFSQYRMLIYCCFLEVFFYIFFFELLIQKATVEPEEISADATGLGTPHPSDVLDMPVDPNEPTYCLCHQVSYGEMIGCDNPDVSVLLEFYLDAIAEVYLFLKQCPIEWFHFACVGLTIKPKGKWYCPKCSQDRKKK